MKTNRKLQIAVTVVALMGMNAGAEADPLGQTCNARLNALSAEWDATGYAPPSKPAAARVVGRNGREITGGQYTFIQNQIRSAAQACRAGDERLAAQRIDYAGNLIARTAGYDTVQTGSIR